MAGVLASALHSNPSTDLILNDFINFIIHFIDSVLLIDSTLSIDRTNLVPKLCYRLIQQSSFFIFLIWFDFTFVFLSSSSLFASRCWPFCHFYKPQLSHIRRGSRTFLSRRSSQDSDGQIGGFCLKTASEGSPTQPQAPPKNLELSFFLKFLKLPEAREWNWPWIQVNDIKKSRQSIDAGFFWSMLTAIDCCCCYCQCCCCCCFCFIAPM